MCGRYYRQADKQRIAEAMHAEVPFAVTPSYNIAPQTMQPVIRLDRETGDREATMMRWGLLPYFAKDGQRPVGDCRYKRHLPRTDEKAPLPRAGGCLLRMARAGREE